MLLPGKRLRGRQLAEGAGRLAEYRHLFAAQQTIKAQQIACGVLRHDQQLSAVAQRSPDFPHGKIKCQRMKLRPHILAVESKMLGASGKQAGDVAMLDHHPLGLASGARGIDDIGQIVRLRRRRQRGSLRGLPLYLVPGGIQRQLRAEVCRPALQAGAGLSEQQRRGGSAQDAVQPLGRMMRLQRQISAAGLEDAEQADQHVKTALTAQRHQTFRAYPAFDQAMRQLVGAAVELAIAQALLTETQRNRLGLTGGVGFKSAVQQGLLWVLAQWPRKIAQQLLALRCRQDIELAQRLFGLVFQRIQQSAQRRLQIAKHALGRHAAINLGRQREALFCTFIIHIQREWIIAALLTGQQGDAVGRIKRLRKRAGAVPVIEQSGKQRLTRRQGAAPLGQCQRCLLMGEQFNQFMLGLLDQFAHAALLQTQAQRQAVDEHADAGSRPCALSLPAPGKHAAKDKVSCPSRIVHIAGTRQQQGKSSMEQGGRRAMPVTRKLAHPLCQRRFQPTLRFADALTIAVYIVQAKGRRAAVDIRQATAEIRRGSGFLLSLRGQGLRQKLPIRPHRRQCQRLIGCRQQGRHFLQQNLQRNVIADQMMQLQQQIMPLPASGSSQLDAQQGCGLQIETRGLNQPRLHLCVQGFSISFNSDISTRRQRVQRLHLFHRQHHLAQNHLHRLGQPLPAQGRAQTVVTLDDLAQGRQKSIALLPCAGKQQYRQNVGIAAGSGWAAGSRRLARASLALGQQRMKKQTFLQWRQGVNVLNIGRPARYRRHDLRDLCRREFKQRQHLRRDLPAGFGNARQRLVEDSRLGLGFLRCRCQPGHRGLLEYGTHIRLPAGLLQTRQHLQYQQRMSTQIKKIVRAADFSVSLRLDIQQILPDCGDALLQLSLRRDIRRAAGQWLSQLRAGQGCLQRLSIELAAVRARPVRWQHIGAGQHVIRQPLLQSLLQRGQINFVCF